MNLLGVTEQEGSEMNERMEEEKSDSSKDDRDDVNSVESLEARKKHFAFDRPKAWELQPVRVANVWDFMPDLVVYKWVKGKPLPFFLVNEIVRDVEPVEQKKKEKEKPKVYKCKHEDCGKVFFDHPSLKKHMLTHGERMVRMVLLIILDYISFAIEDNWLTFTSSCAHMKDVERNSLTIQNSRDIISSIQYVNLVYLCLK